MTFFEIVVFLHVARQDRHGVEVVGRNIEEALDLAGMQVERQTRGRRRLR